MKYGSALALFLGAAIPVQASFSWKNVKIGGGGGFIPGIVFHPKTKGVAYARADIGGLYRLNSDDSWTAITDGIANDAGWHNWGIDAVALDPQNDEKIYAAVGMYTNSWDPNNGAIIRSSDRGATWSFSNLTFKVGGNMPGRGTGERLAVDPANSNIIYFGARSGNGLWKSTDGGVTFSKVASFTDTGPFVPDPSDTTGYNSDKQGLLWVTFDSTSGTTGGATSRIFVGTADNITASVYVSTNAGSTWTAVPGQPGRYFPHKAKLQPTEKALYLTYSDGTTWSPLWAWASYPAMTYYYSISTPLAPWIKNDFIDVTSETPPGGIIKRLGWMIESLEIDPLDSNHWLYGTGMTIFGGHDLTKWDTIHNVTIQSLADGIEETAIQGLASAPGGSELLVALGDENGYTFTSASNLGTSPQTVWSTPTWTTSTSVDYAGNSVKNVVRVGNTAGTQQVAISSDGGVTWNIDYGADTNMNGGTVAYSANADTILWSTGSTGVQRSQYQGSFTSVSSLPAAAVIAADKKTNSLFYAGYASTFYVSNNTGSSFTAGPKLGSATSIRDIIAHPATAGTLYVSTDAGIFRSTDSGTTFTQVSTAITNTYQIALGLGSGSNWNLYAFGTGSAGNRLYASADNGATWTDIQGGTQGFGTIDGAKLAGSASVSGQVYVGTNGRGVFYAQGTISGDTGGSSSSSTRRLALQDQVLHSITLSAEALAGQARHNACHRILAKRKMIITHNAFK
ncbi:xyloglucanase [Trichoderma asperellum]|uniref:Xyloglucanase n=1 Tax=Trichoderma asperellum TaxID=101201 RepID=A0A6V8QPN5_TRIAP|nr:xyloglucanase [Trichoderma asperellum]